MVEVVLGLISDSLDAWRTRQYGEHSGHSRRSMGCLPPRWRKVLASAPAHLAVPCLPSALSHLARLALSPSSTDYYQRVLNGIL